VYTDVCYGVCVWVVCYVAPGQSKYVVFEDFVLCPAQPSVSQTAKALYAHIWQATVQSKVCPLCQPGHNTVSASVISCGAQPAAIRYLKANTHYSSGALIPECNGLSQTLLCLSENLIS